MTAIPFTVKVRNILGVAKADLTIGGGIVLVAGTNAVGKSSLLEATAAALLADPAIRGLRTKADQAHALKDGAAAGSIILDYEGGRVRIAYPGSEIEQTGRPRSWGTALGIGRYRWMAIKAEDRAREFSERFKANPTANDMLAWLAAHPGSGLEGNGAEAAEARAQLWADIEDQGWDGVAKRCQEYGVRRKGAWEQVTKIRWGEKKAATWMPPGMDPAETYDTEAIASDIANDRAEIAQLTQAEMAASVDLERLRADVAEAKEAERTLATQAAELEGLAEQIEKATKERRAIAVPTSDDRGGSHLCPHCTGALLIERDERGHSFLRKAPPPPSAEAMNALRVKAAELDGIIASLTTSHTALMTAQVRTKASIEKGTASAAKIAALRDVVPVDKAHLEELRAAMLADERLLSAIKLHEEARSIYEDWVRNSILLEALKPEGVRASVIDRHISRANVRLAEICETVRISPTTLDQDMSLRYGGRPYGLLSESEKWRADFAMAALLNLTEDAPVLLLDRFDVIVPQDRGPLLLGMKKLKLPVLMAMTAKDRDAVPNLAKAGVGAALWASDGTVGPCH